MEARLVPGLERVHIALVNAEDARQPSVKAWDAKFNAAMTALRKGLSPERSRQTSDADLAQFAEMTQLRANFETEAMARATAAHQALLDAYESVYRDRQAYYAKATRLAAPTADVAAEQAEWDARVKEIYLGKTEQITMAVQLAHLKEMRGLRQLLRRAELREESRGAAPPVLFARMQQAEAAGDQEAAHFYEQQLETAHAAGAFGDPSTDAVKQLVSAIDAHRDARLSDDDRAVFATFDEHAAEVDRLMARQRQRWSATEYVGHLRFSEEFGEPPVVDPETLNAPAPTAA